MFSKIDFVSTVAIIPSPTSMNGIRVIKYDSVIIQVIINTLYITNFVTVSFIREDLIDFHPFNLIDDHIPVKKSIIIKDPTATNAPICGSKKTARKPKINSNFSIKKLCIFNNVYFMGNSYGSMDKL